MCRLLALRLPLEGLALWRIWHCQLLWTGSALSLPGTFESVMVVECVLRCSADPQIHITVKNSVQSVALCLERSVLVLLKCIYIYNIHLAFGLSDHLERRVPDIK